MTERPQYLVIVTHSLDGSFELFSAHYMDTEAQVMHDRLADLLAGSPDSVHIVEVPETAGVVKSTEPPSEARIASRLQVAAAPAPPAPAEKPAPFRRLSREEFAAETEAMEMSGARVIDTPDPGYNGAFS